MPQAPSVADEFLRDHPRAARLLALLPLAIVAPVAVSTALGRAQLMKHEPASAGAVAAGAVAGKAASGVAVKPPVRKEAPPLSIPQLVQHFESLPVAGSYDRQAAPPGTINLVIPLVHPVESEFPEEWDYHNVSTRKAAEDMQAWLVRHAGDSTAPIDLADVSRSFREVARRQTKIHHLLIDGHSTYLRDKEARALCLGDKACQAASGDGQSVGLQLSSPAHEMLVPGLLQLLRDAARAENTTVRELFADGAVIELRNCFVGLNTVWVQELADLTGARVVAYRGFAHATHGATLLEYRAFAQQAPTAQRRADEDQVVFTPSASRGINGAMQAR